MCLTTQAAKNLFLIPDPNLPSVTLDSCLDFMGMKSFGALEPQPGEKVFLGVAGAFCLCLRSVPTLTIP